MKNNLVLNEFYEKFASLTVYRDILKDETASLFLECTKKAVKGKPSKAVYDLIKRFSVYAEEEGLEGNIILKYMVKLFLSDENVYALSCEKNMDTIGSSIYEMAEKDVNMLEFLRDIQALSVFPEKAVKLLCDYKPVKILDNGYLDEIINNGSIFESITGYYKSMGCGEMAYRPMFRYDSEKNEIVGIKNPDLTDFNNIIGYEYQKQALKNNTEAFLNGYNAGNALLVGSRGTGKSTCVKALPKEYFHKGLRILEISKEQLVMLPKIMELLSKRGKHIIIFIDDLSFEDFEIEYKYLKSLLEGSAEARPGNVLFYATSNRRHIIQEKWSDKNTHPEDEELHTSDMINEKLSLSDRFGLTLTFPKPSPKEYVEIVKGLAKNYDIHITEEELRQKSLSWELNNKGISGRSARQFIDSLVWELKK